MSSEKFEFSEKDKKAIGDRIWGLFEERGYKKQIEVVKEYELGKMMISRYVRGETVDPGFLKHLHQRFGVCISWLLTGQGNKYDRPKPIQPKPTK